MKVTTISHEKQQLKVNLYLGYAFVALGGIGLLFNTSYWLNGLHLFVGIVNILAYYAQKKHAYTTFSETGITEPRSFNLLKPKYLAYKDIDYADYIVGDYVFRNKKVEFRFQKELLNQEEIDFLEHKIQVLKAPK